jgi:hypothetical protein
VRQTGPLVRMPPLDEPCWDIDTAVGLVELHADAAFRSLLHTTDGTLILTWTGYDDFIGDRSRRLQKVEMIFQGVDRFTATARDPMVPRSESECLSLLCFTTGTFPVNAYVDFRGGVRYEIGAQSLSLALTTDDDADR